MEVTATCYFSRALAQHCEEGVLPRPPLLILWSSVPLLLLNLSEGEFCFREKNFLGCLWEVMFTWSFYRLLIVNRFPFYLAFFPFLFFLNLEETHKNGRIGPSNNP